MPLLNSERGNSALCRLCFPVSQPAVAYTGEWLIRALWPSACKTSNIIILIYTSLLFAIVIKSEVRRWVWSAAVLGSAVQELAVPAHEDEGWYKQTAEGFRSSGVFPAPCPSAAVLPSCSPAALAAPLSSGMPAPLQGSSTDKVSLWFPGLPCGISCTRELRGVLPPASFHGLPQPWEGIILCLTCYLQITLSSGQTRDKMLTESSHNIQTKQQQCC